MRKQIKLFRNGDAKRLEKSVNVFLAQNWRGGKIFLPEIKIMGAYICVITYEDID